jgi:predicted metal-dependent hydrolase
MCHETLEEHWIEAPKEERDFYQALIHLAVGFHHYVRGNQKGARAQFVKAMTRFSTYPEEFYGVDVAGIRSFLEEAAGKLENGDTLVPPKLET